MTVAGRLRDLRKELTARKAADPSPVAAIEVVSPDASVRGSDLCLVREHLDAGEPPEALDELLVTVFTDLAYEVDWKDQFSFWPLLHEHLRSARFDLRDHGPRRQVAHFEAFSEVYGGVKPVGEMAEQFSLMSWPLIHAVMPRCAQRHLSGAIARAAKLGLTPTSHGEPWPDDFAQQLRASIDLPTFVLGIIEHRDALARLGRELLHPVPDAAEPSWVRRMRQSVGADPISRGLIEEAREATKQSSRTSASKLPITLELSQGAIGTLWLSVGPYAASVGASPRVVSFARTNAVVRAKANDHRVGEVALFNALGGPCLFALTKPTLPLRVAATVAPEQSNDEVPEVLAPVTERTFSGRLVFAQSGGNRFELVDTAREGDDVAVVCSASADHGANGLERRAIRGTDELVAWVGALTATNAHALGVETKDRGPTLVPRVLPPLRRNPKGFTYVEGRDAWLELIDAPRDATIAATITPANEGSNVEVGLDQGGRMLVRASGLSVGVCELRCFVDGSSRSIASTEIRIEASRSVRSVERWRATLRPADATVEQLREGHCYIEVELLPEVELDVTIAATARPIPPQITLSREDVRSPFKTARLLRDLCEALAEGGAPPSEVSVLARERGAVAWTTIATLNARSLGLRFVFSADGVAAESPDDEPSIARLSFTEDRGLRRESVERVSEPGVYVAAAGAALTGLVIPESVERIPRIMRARGAERSFERASELLRTLRAVEVATIDPRERGASGLWIRRAWARSLERELVIGLCGADWAKAEDQFADRAIGFGDFLGWIARLLWIEEVTLATVVNDAEDPIQALSDVTTLYEARAPSAEARHLTMTLCNRGMTSRSGDDDALRWALLSVRRARTARIAALAPALAERLHGNDDGN